MEQKYFKLAEASKYTGLGKSTLQKLDRSGVLVAIRNKTNRRVYTLRQLKEFMEGKREK